MLKEHRLQHSTNGWWTAELKLRTLLIFPSLARDTSTELEPPPSDGNASEELLKKLRAFDAQKSKRQCKERNWINSATLLLSDEDREWDE